MEIPNNDLVKAEEFYMSYREHYNSGLASDALMYDTYLK